MKKYILICKNFEPEIFDAEDDAEAEQWVNRNFNDDDGEMKLYRLEHLVSWQ